VRRRLAWGIIGAAALAAVGAVLVLGPDTDPAPERFTTQPAREPERQVKAPLTPEARRVAMRMPAAVFARAGGVAGTRVTSSGGMTVAMGGVGTGAPGFGVMATEPLHAASFEAHTSVRQLPSQQMEGVLVDGTRSTMTIPAGQVGNLQPIEVVSERWFSKELNAVVLSRTSDPRFGETIYRLESVVRGEPSPELFQVPADYQIQGMAR